MAETFFQWGEADGPGLVQPGKGDGFGGPNTTWKVLRQS